MHSQMENNIHPGVTVCLGYVGAAELGVFLANFPQLRASRFKKQVQ